MNNPSNFLPSDQIIIDLRTTCSKDEAAAKLLGWLRGPIHPKYIQITTSEVQKKKNEEQNPATLDGLHDSLPYRISEAQLKNLHSLDCTLAGSLNAQLLELHDAALLEFDDAMVEPDLEVKANAVEYWKNQIRRAAAYLRDIDDELANGDESELKVDKKASKKAEVPQILLSSLDRWAKKKYNFSIFDDVKSDISEIAILDDVHEDFSEDGTLKKVYADNLLFTLALFVEAFSKTATRYHKEDGPVVIAIAKKMEELAKEANGGSDVPTGQKHGAIKLRITEAMKRKKKILSGM